MGILTEGVVQHIAYGSDNNDCNVDRYIVPVVVPNQHTKAIDISHLTADEQVHVASLVQEYASYVELNNRRLFKFEDWVLHTKGETITPKWRLFSLSKITILP
jgi:hypothetical protein